MRLFDFWKLPWFAQHWNWPSEWISITVQFFTTKLLDFKYNFDIRPMLFTDFKIILTVRNVQLRMVFPSSFGIYCETVWVTLRLQYATHYKNTVPYFFQNSLNIQNIKNLNCNPYEQIFSGRVLHELFCCSTSSNIHHHQHHHNRVRQSLILTVFYKYSFIWWLLFW